MTDATAGTDTVCSKAVATVATTAAADSTEPSNTGSGGSGAPTPPHACGRSDPHGRLTTPMVRRGEKRALPRSGTGAAPGWGSGGEGAQGLMSTEGEHPTQVSSFEHAGEAVMDN